MKLLKKEKTNTKQSEKFGKRVLIPLLSKKEASKEFVKKIAGEKGEIILLLVIDTGAMSGGFGFAAHEIAQGNLLMQKTKILLEKHKKKCNDVIEWGNTESKIEHLAQLQQVNKILLVQQESPAFGKLLREMKEKLKGIEIETVKVKEEEKKESSGFSLHRPHLP